MDIDNDGKLDLVAGDASGNVWFFRNIGTKQKPELAAGVKLESDGKPIVGVHANYQEKNGQYHVVPNDKDVIGVYSKIFVGDWDGDGLNDLLVGQDGPNGGSQIMFYKNIGTANQPKYDKPAEIKLPGGPFSRMSPYLYDLDGDGKLDLLCGIENGEVQYFHNKGTKTAPVLENGVKLPLQGEGLQGSYRWRICVTDWNNDGKPDLLVGNYANRGGNIWLFLGK
ncbi:MAG TPA: VCBS repeat-containing protein [Planctomycetota bacterium]